MGRRGKAVVVGVGVGVVGVVGGEEVEEVVEEVVGEVMVVEVEGGSGVVIVEIVAGGALGDGLEGERDCVCVCVCELEVVGCAGCSVVYRTVPSRTVPSLPLRNCTVLYCTVIYCTGRPLYLSVYLEHGWHFEKIYIRDLRLSCASYSS